MSVAIREELEAAVAVLRAADAVTFREVEACLRASREVLVAAGSGKDQFSAVAGRIIDVLVERKVLETADAGALAARVISEALLSLVVVKTAEVEETGACLDCEGEAWGAGPAVSPSGKPLPLSAQDRRVTLSGGAVPQTRFRAAQGTFSCDHSHPTLDRAAVRRLMRSIGPDFGPEPPAGGSLARV